MFDDRLKNLRKSRGLSQLEISKHLGLKPRTYVSYENNEREPDSQVLIKIAQFFDVSIDYLLDFNANSQVSVPFITKKELQIIKAYRNQPDMQKAVNKLLGIAESPPLQIVQTKKPPDEVEEHEPMLRYARTDDLTSTQPRKLTKEQWEELENGEDVDLN